MTVRLGFSFTINPLQQICLHLRDWLDGAIGCSKRGTPLVRSGVFQRLFFLMVIYVWQAESKK
jgi:hypothetical protein